MAPTAPNIASPLATIAASLELVCCCATDCSRNARPVDSNPRYKRPGKAAMNPATVSTSRFIPIARQAIPQTRNCINVSFAAFLYRFTKSPRKTIHNEKKAADARHKTSPRLKPFKAPPLIMAAPTKLAAAAGHIKSAGLCLRHIHAKIGVRTVVRLTMKPTLVTVV